MKQSTKRLTSVLFSLLFLIGAFLVYFDLVSPAYSDLQVLKGKQASELAFLSEASTTMQQVQKLIATYQSESQAESMVALAVPTGKDVSGAIAQIYGIAQVNNIDIQDVSVSTVSSLQGATSTKASGASLVKPLGNISFVIAASGNYENFKSFLSEIETNIRIFDIKNVSVQPVSATSGSQDLFNYSVSIIAYYQNP